MKYIFIVQGEGRGHLTQAISLAKLLSKNGHEVSHVVVGKSKRRELPKFFFDEVDAPITQLASPNFITDRKSKSVKLFKSVIFNLLKLNRYLKSIEALHQLIEKEKPDAIINFYDFLGGLYYLLKKPAIKHIAIAHQFLISHPTFDFPKGRLYDKASLRFGNKLAAFKASKTLALSFQHFEDLPDKQLFVVPPLLRQEVKTQKVSAEDHFLVYMVNHGYAEQVESFHRKHPEIPIHCFWDNREAAEVEELSENLTFHQLNDTKFIAFMASCRGYLTTAGFESVCEAMYMGKPVLMVPVQGHYEQACNALDAKKAGAGVSSEIFDLQVLLNYLPSHQNVKVAFQEWCEQTEERFIKNLTDYAN